MSRDRKITVACLIALPVMMFGYNVLNHFAWIGLGIVLSTIIFILIAPRE